MITFSPLFPKFMFEICQSTRILFGPLPIVMYIVGVLFSGFNFRFPMIDEAESIVRHRSSLGENSPHRLVCLNVWSLVELFGKNSSMALL